MEKAVVESNKNLIKSLMEGVNQRRAIIEIALKRIELRKYLLSVGWTSVDVENILEQGKNSFAQGITYAKEISKKAGLSKRKQDFIWEKLRKYSNACKGKIELV